MANTIVTPTQPVQDATPVASIIIGLLVVAILALLFFFYGLPAIQGPVDTTNTTNSPGINMTVPENTINTNPGTIDVGSPNPAN